MSPPLARPIAAVDIGSNSIHLTLARVHPDGRIEVLDRIKDAARLGASVQADRRISGAGIKRAVRTLRRFRRAADAIDAELRATATAAVRGALNRDEFVRRAQREAGVPVEVISGQEEARLTYQGVLVGLPDLSDARALCIDIGGGSTELIVGEGGRALITLSVDIGSLSVTRQLLGRYPVRRKTINRARAVIAERLGPVARTVREAGFDRAVATSGSVQRIGKVVIAAMEARGEPPGPLHGLILDRRALSEVNEVLAGASTKARRLRIPGIDADRADTLFGGSLILEALTELLDVEAWVLSMAALRTGLIIDTMHRRPP